MELRVWVDGTQRVVCGVKLTTTCQEIVFALAHATQQAGRFTMIERWRNNERLLSPNEQPLVTLQRWGDHMNEVEFILRKTSTDIPINPSISQIQQQPTQRSQQNISRTSLEEASQHDLYSTINKKRISQPPAVPAKPRVMGPLTSVNNAPLPHHQLQSVNNAQVNYYHNQSQSPLNMYPGSLRLRHPPGYLDYMEAMASRSSITQTNPTYTPQNQHASNIFRPFDAQQLYNMPRVNSSPAEVSCSSNRYPYSMNGQINNHADHDHQNHDGTSVSQMGHDMLKVIEEQKKVLLNQKSELVRLDNEKQNSKQVELINRIESEIHQLGGLWKENQTQIQKLENQDFEKELQELKSEQVKMEVEISKQREKLSRFEEDILLCKGKIQQLEAELETLESDASMDCIPKSPVRNHEQIELIRT